MAVIWQWMKLIPVVILFAVPVLIVTRRARVGESVVIMLRLWRTRWFSLLTLLLLGFIPATIIFQGGNAWDFLIHGPERVHVIMAKVFLITPEERANPLVGNRVNAPLATSSQSIHDHYAKLGVQWEESNWQPKAGVYALSIVKREKPDRGEKARGVFVTYEWKVDPVNDLTEWSGPYAPVKEYSQLFTQNAIWSKGQIGALTNG